MPPADVCASAPAVIIQPAQLPPTAFSPQHGFCYIETGENTMEIRKYREDDSKELARLFYHTVHTVNAADYTDQQLDAWAPAVPDPVSWHQSFSGHNCLIAADNGIIIGFADMDDTCCLHRLFVHPEHQREGIASALCSRLEENAAGTITTYASITAMPFFRKRGYQIITKQKVMRRGVLLTNYVMQKEKSDLLRTQKSLK